MKKILTNYRYYVLTLLMGVCIIGLMLEPVEDQPFTSFMWAMLATKGTMFAAGYLFYRLYRRWEKRGTISELVEFVQEY